MKSEPRYATEVALCADFLEWVKRESGAERGKGNVPVWTAYAETAGWDILLVAEDGTQIGVQAKLKFNMKVLCQTVPDDWGGWSEVGPDFRAILVPEHDSSHEKLCGALGVMMFWSHRASEGRPASFSPDLDLKVGRGYPNWHSWNPKKRCPLPDYVPDVIAGDSGPRQLTHWKVNALRVMAILEIQGFITRPEFRLIGIDARAWTGPAAWLKAGAEPGHFVRGSAAFDKQHPTVYAQVLADMRKTWKPQPGPAQASLIAAS